MPKLPNLTFLLSDSMTPYMWHQQSWHRLRLIWTELGDKEKSREENSVCQLDVCGSTSTMLGDSEQVSVWFCCNAKTLGRIAAPSFPRPEPSPLSFRAARTPSCPHMAAASSLTHFHFISYTHCKTKSHLRTSSWCWLNAMHSGYICFFFPFLKHIKVHSIKVCSAFRHILFLRAMKVEQMQSKEFDQRDFQIFSK